MNGMSQSEITADDPSQGPAPKTLGLARWVQLAFVAFALLLLWLLDKVITVVWNKFAEPEPLYVTLAAVVLSGATTFALYRHATVSRVASEIVGELAKVTWPSREEIQASTIVVIVTSIIASIIVGAFDAAWSTITDLIYKV
jgi:preprotein translocase SecE subunit